MKNADLPAMPTEPIFTPGNDIGYYTQSNGLTKREMFAMAAMQGLLASAITLPEDVAQSAVIYADDLLAELERKKLKQKKNCCGWRLRQ